MKKRILAGIVVLMLLTMSLVGLVGCMPFSLDKYLMKMSNKDNYTLTFAWKTQTGKAIDYLHFTKDAISVSTAFEQVADLSKQNDVVVYLQMNNYWQQSTVTRDRYLQSMGFEEKGKIDGVKLYGSGATAKAKMMNYIQTALKLAATDLDNKFNVVERKYELRTDCLYDVFGSDFNGSSVVIYLESGEARAQLAFGVNTLDFTISNVGSTKVKITKLMKNSDIGNFIK